MPGARQQITQKLRGSRSLRWMTLVTAIALFFAVSFWQTEAWNQRLAIKAVHHLGSATAVSYSMLLQSEIEKRSLVPFIMAYDPDVIAAVSAPASVPASPTLAAERTALNRKLEILSDGGAASVIYILDTSGLAVASSNWNQPTSFLGHNFALRPYFYQARTNGTGEYFALGLLNHLPGLFLAQRIEENGQFLGVVVVKVQFNHLEDRWAQSGARFLVTDDQGVVVVTDVPNWQFRTIAPLPEKIRTSLRAKAEYGAASLTPLPFDVADAHRVSGAGCKRFVAISAPVPTTHWTIYFLAPIDTALSLRRNQALLSAFLLTTLVFGLAGIIRARLRHRIVVKAQADEMKRLATTDSLTQLLNRRAFETLLDQEWSRARRAGTSLAVIMLDVDHFKLFNDLYGHLAGDACLRRIAGVLRDGARRPGDAVARYGGEEFIILLPNTDLAGAIRIAETMLEATRTLEIAHEKAPLTGQVTISVGIGTADFVARDAVSAMSLISAADKALYEAKRAGRNRLAYEESDTRSAEAICNVQ